MGNPLESLTTIRSLAAEFQFLNCLRTVRQQFKLRRKVQIDRQQFGPAATLFSLSPRCDMWRCDRCLAARNRRGKKTCVDWVTCNDWKWLLHSSTQGGPAREPHTPNWERIAPLVFQCCNAHQTGSSSNVEVLPLRSPVFHSHRTGSSPT